MSPSARTIVFQPAGSNLCGHACVAMVAGITLDESVEAFRRAKVPAGLTGARHLRKVLRWFHWDMPGEAVKFKKQISTSSGLVDLRGLWICRMRWSGVKKSHWVVVDEGHVLDPGLEHLVAEGMTTDEAAAVYIRDTKGYLSSGYQLRAANT